MTVLKPSSHCGLRAGPQSPSPLLGFLFSQRGWLLVTGRKGTDTVRQQQHERLPRRRVKFRDSGKEEALTPTKGVGPGSINDGLGSGRIDRHALSRLILIGLGRDMSSELSPAGLGIKSF